MGNCRPQLHLRYRPLPPRMQAIWDALDPCQKLLRPLLAQLRALIEANTARRKPKIAKGTRDFRPDQMTIRKHVFQAGLLRVCSSQRRGPGILTVCFVMPC